LAQEAVPHFQMGVCHGFVGKGIQYRLRVVLQAQVVARAVRSQERVLPEAPEELVGLALGHTTPALVAREPLAMLEMAAMAVRLAPATELLVLAVAAVARAALEIIPLFQFTTSGAAAAVAA
jgi:hypothetical protein